MSAICRRTGRALGRFSFYSGSVVDPGDAVEVATEDRPELVFDARGTVVHANIEQELVTVKLYSGQVKMYPLHQIRFAGH